MLTIAVHWPVSRTQPFIYVVTHVTEPDPEPQTVEKVIDMYKTDDGRRCKRRVHRGDEGCELDATKRDRDRRGALAAPHMKRRKGGRVTGLLFSCWFCGIPFLELN